MDRIRHALRAALVEKPSDWTPLTITDWQGLLTTAQADGLLPLLHCRFDTLGWPNTMPPELRRAIQLGSYSAVAQNGLLYSELARVLTALAPLTTVVVLKGAALGPTIYPAAALRPLSDIDLLVPERDLGAAIAALQALGYREMPELTPGINRLVEYHTRLNGGPNGGVIVEIHWRLVAGAADWRSPSHDWMWQQIEPWQPDSLMLPAQTVWQLRPTAHLLYLAAHLVLQHGSAQSRLIWLYDLHLLLTQNGDRILWPEVIERARQLRWADALQTALLATRQIFSTTLPDDVFSALSTTIDRSAAAFAQRKASMPPDPTLSEWLKLQSLEPRARLRFISSLICPSPSYIRWRYQARPMALWPLCYLYHWLRIARAALQIAANLVNRRSMRSAEE